MNIQGLTLDEIAEKMTDYLPLFLKGTLKFQESYLLYFNEISHNTPVEYWECFDDADMVNCASASIELENYEHDFIVSLVSNADYSEALFLALIKVDKQTGAEETSIFKSFITEGE